MHVLAFLAGWQRSISGCGLRISITMGRSSLEYAIDRFTMEAKRQLHVLDQRLAGRPFIPGKDYSVADIASFPWYGGLMLGW
jgi:GST-like protein